MESTKLKCRKCRDLLLDGNCLVNSHGESISECKDLHDSCMETHKEQLWYINYDVSPQWVKDCLDKGDWLRGKLFCPKCMGRLGSFNFVQPRKCACSRGIAQPVWVLKSRIDLGIKPNIRQPKPNTIDESWTLISEAHLHGQNTSVDNSSSSSELGTLTNISDTNHVNTEQKRVSITSSDELAKRLRIKNMIKIRKKGRSPRSNQLETKLGTHQQQEPTSAASSNCLVTKKPYEKFMEDHTCPICLDVYFIPTCCMPCNHVFCDPCIRQLVHHSDVTQCPICRQRVLSFNVKEDLHQKLKVSFPRIYRKRQKLQKKLGTLNCPIKQLSVQSGRLDHYFVSVIGIFMRVRQFSLELFMIFTFIIISLILYCFTALIMNIL